MSRHAAANFVDEFFTATLFQADDVLAASTLQSQLSPSAQIVINGNNLSAETFISLIKDQFRTAQFATIDSIKDLNTTSDAGDAESGAVAQYTVYTVVNKCDGVSSKQSATTIVQVAREDGRLVVTGLWEAQTPLQE